MHFIQKHILDQLRETGDMRYATLQPDGIESSHFRYHLKELERAKYLESPKRGVYRLTLKGQHFVDRLSRHSVNPINMPKVITYTLLKKGEDYLLQPKDKEPYKGLLNMIGGKVHEGETTLEASCREVHEKTGIEIVAPTLGGVYEIIIRNQESLLTHAIAYVYIAQVSNSAGSKLVSISKSELAKTSGLAPDTLRIITSLSATNATVNTLEIVL